MHPELYIFSLKFYPMKATKQNENLFFSIHEKKKDLRENS